MWTHEEHIHVIWKVIGWNLAIWANIFVFFSNVTNYSQFLPNILPFCQSALGTIHYWNRFMHKPTRVVDSKRVLRLSHYFRPPNPNPNPNLIKVKVYFYAQSTKVIFSSVSTVCLWMFDMCLLRFPFNLNLWSQIKHLTFFSPLWVNKWVFKVPAVSNESPHSTQL